MATTPLPNPNCYWVTSQLLAGEYPGKKQPDEARASLKRFLDCGVTFFLDLTEPHELAPYEFLLKEEAAKLRKTVEYRRLSIRDVDVPKTKEQMQDILDCIDEALQAGHIVYVHCWGGVGRTGTVVGCWLVRHDMTGEQALAQLAELWKTVEKAWRKPHCPETQAQREWIRAWSETSNQ